MGARIFGWFLFNILYLSWNYTLSKAGSSLLGWDVLLETHSRGIDILLIYQSQSYVYSIRNTSFSSLVAAMLTRLLGKVWKDLWISVVGRLVSFQCFDAWEDNTTYRRTAPADLFRLATPNVPASDKYIDCLFIWKLFAWMECCSCKHTTQHITAAHTSQQGVKKYGYQVVCFECN